MTVTEIISRVNTDLQTARQLSKRHTLNKSINLEMMPLLSWLLNPQPRSLCQCRFVARLPPGGSSFLKPSMRPAQMTSPTSRYPYCQKMASASSKRTSVTYHHPPFPLPNPYRKSIDPFLSPLVQD
jgi:hypothetical protein